MWKSRGFLARSSSPSSPRPLPRVSASMPSSRRRTALRPDSGFPPPTRRLRRTPGSGKGLKRRRRRSSPPTRSSGSVQRPETKARARALQLLYAWELSGEPSIETVVARVATIYGRVPRGYDRGADLASKAIAGRPEFDRRVKEAAEHWRLERVGVVERNILRLALAELDEASTPSRVVIDEAVKLAHWFAGARAPAFVNGILDAVARETGAL